MDYVVSSRVNLIRVKDLTPGTYFILNANYGVGNKTEEAVLIKLKQSNNIVPVYAINCNRESTAFRISSIENIPSDFCTCFDLSHNEVVLVDHNLDVTPIEQEESFKFKIKALWG